MFVQHYPTQMRERSVSRSKGSSTDEAIGSRSTRERSSSTSSNRDIYSKRSSIFSKRPKSILTTASNDSSTRSLASNSSGSDTSRLSPSGDALAAEVDNHKARFTFGRGIKNRMSGIRAFPAYGDSHRTQSEQRRSAAGGELRISAPFDFQHVAKIEESETIGGQRPEVLRNFRTLSKGHRHAVIAPALNEEDGEDQEDGLVVKQRKSAPLRPRRPDDLWSHGPANAPLPRNESHHDFALSHDGERVPMSADYRGLPLPRRLPMRPSLGLSQSFSGDSNQVLDIAKSSQDSDPFDAYDPFIPLYDSQPPGWIENSLPLLHTVSPIELFPDHVRTPAFHPPLEQVPEEPEGSFSNRPSRDLPRRPSLRHSKSTPVIANRFRSSIDPFVDSFPLPSTTVPNERPSSQCSQGSDTLGNSPGSYWHETKPKTKARSLDLGDPSKSAEPSWEDYIEYCYEHNAEADCDFNWQEMSHFDDNDSEASESWSEQLSPFSTSLKSKLEDSRSMKSTMSHAHSMVSEKSDRTTSHSSVPELDYRFSRATSTASLSIATPRDGSLYRMSDVPPLPTDLHNMKDVWSTQFTGGDQLYNEIMVGRTAVVPDSPVHPDDRQQTILYSGADAGLHKQKLLPRPPFDALLQSNRAPKMKSRVRNDFEATILDSTDEKVWPPAKEPHDTIATSISSKPTSAAKKEMTASWPLEDQIKPPTPPKSPTEEDLESARSFLSTPSPTMVAKSKPTIVTTSRSSPKSPIHISFPSIDLPPLTLPTSPPSPAANFSRIRSGSVADRIGALPVNTSPKYVDQPGTPDSATSAPEGFGRTGYSLFPSKKPSMNSLQGPALPVAPTSVPTAMSEPSLTRPASRAASQASSSRSSSRALSFKSKSSKKANAYQERFPLGI